MATHAGLGDAFVASVSHYPADSARHRLVAEHVVFARPYADSGLPLDPVRQAEGLAGIAIVPMRCDGELVGVLNVASHTREQLSEPSVAAIAAIAAVSGATLRRLSLEARSREQERQYRALFETMAQGVVYQEADGRISGANPAAERILGLSLDQLQGRTSTDPRWRATRADGSDFPGEEHPAMQALRTGQAVRGVVMGVVDPQSDRRRWILVNAIPELRDGEARPFRVFTSFEDITDAKENEVALVRARDDLQRLAEHLQTAVEEERKAVAREIHDELGQGITAMKLDVEWLRAHLAAEPSGVREKVEALAGVVDQTLGTVRTLARRLRPAMLDDLGLVPALRWLIDDFEQHAGVTVLVRLPADSLAVEDRVAIAVFRFVQEALTNVARHAAATRVEVSLRAARGALAVRVRDNGRGLPTERLAATGSYGLVGILERVSSLGGAFEAVDVPSGGTELRADIPLAARPAAATGSRSRTTTRPRSRRP